MEVKETNLVKMWKEASQILNGTFRMPIQTQNFGMATEGIYHFQIDIPYRNLNIRIYSGIENAKLFINNYFSTILITAEKETIEKVELSIWRKDFFDNLLSFNKSNTGFREFDKTIGLKASRNIERYLPQIFKEKELRKELTNDKYRTYNIQTVENKIVVQRKSGLRMKNAKMIIEEYEKFKLFIDGLINVKII